MSGKVPIEIEDKPTAVGIIRELVEHLQDTKPCTWECCCPELLSILNPPTIFR
jgi:hypothetical protein